MSQRQQLGKNAKEFEDFHDTQPLNFNMALNTKMKRKTLLTLFDDEPYSHRKLEQQYLEYTKHMNYNKEQS